MHFFFIPKYRLLSGHIYCYCLPECGTLKTLWTNCHMMLSLITYAEMQTKYKHIAKLGSIDIWNLKSDKQYINIQVIVKENFNMHTHIHKLKESSIDIYCILASIILNTILKFSFPFLITFYFLNLFSIILIHSLISMSTMYFSKKTQMAHPRKPISSVLIIFCLLTKWN